MSFAEIKVQVAELPEEQRLELQALLTYVARKDNPEYHAEMERQMAEMDAGKKFSLQDAKRLHQELVEQGR